MISWDVLEHLNDPRAAVKNLASSLRPGGILILAIPNLRSFKGITTKLTPFSVHLFFYRHVAKGKYVDTDQRNQFRTFLRRDIAPKALQQLLLSEGCDVAFLHLYEGPVPTRLRKQYRWFDLMSRAISTVSRGHQRPNRLDRLGSPHDCPEALTSERRVMRPSGAAFASSPSQQRPPQDRVIGATAASNWSRRWSGPIEALTEVLEQPLVVW